MYESIAVGEILNFECNLDNMKVSAAIRMVMTMLPAVWKV